MSTVSVICSVKNGESIIEETIQSIQHQTFQDWEFIIVDDGSTDDTKKIVSKYISEDNRIRLIPTEGIGRAEALNLAVSHANGEYIANIDADDPSHPMRIQYQYQAFQEYPDYALVAADYILILDEQKVDWPQVEEKLNITPLNQQLPYYNPIHHSSVMMQRAALIKAGSYNTGLSSLLDYELWVRLASNHYKLGKLTLPLSSKRIHSNQSFENKKRMKYLMQSFRIQQMAIKSLKGSLPATISMYLRFLYGILPQRLRVSIKNIVIART
ncbi:glycosyltransferase [Bacillus sp. 165]|uniref:glycosyltransferase n=1 Tax=Bacillus sp. 165 TaxID=1529117 RepID=UPI001ADAE747|nr:glycosyltransferase [Bacillus sp. 165]MBO9130004.1 glycosyltransferase [Bacillus sp. 165]